MSESAGNRSAGDRNPSGTNLTPSEVAALKTFFPALGHVIDSLANFENVIAAAELHLRRRNDLLLAEKRITEQGESTDRAIKGHRDAIAHERRSARLLGGALRNLHLTTK